MAAACGCCGRELDFPETAATVRVRDGETLVSDGPFAETKEFIAGFDLLECADLDEAIEVAAKHPVAWFQTVEIRPFKDEPRLGEQALAFGRGEDGAASPYLLIMWVGGTSAAPFDDQAVMDEGEAWRRDLRGTAASTSWGTRCRARTRRRRSACATGRRCSATGRSSAPTEFIAGIDVVSCADRQQAIELAAAHPIARYHAIEVRPFL